MKKLLFLLLELSVSKRIRTLNFDNDAVVKWSYDVNEVSNPNSTLRFEILTKNTEFSFGWNR